MTYPGLSMWNGSSKIHYFIDFWHSFCWRLWRPCMLLLTKSKGHMSNFHYSGFPQHLQTKSNLHISISQSKLKHKYLPLDTLYMHLFIKVLTSIVLMSFLKTHTTSCGLGLGWAPNSRVILISIEGCSKRNIWWI